MKNSGEMNIHNKRFGVVKTIILIYGLQFYEENIGGDALSGKVENSEFYIMNADFEYIEVTPIIYILDIILWILSFVIGLGSMGLFIYNGYVDVMKKLYPFSKNDKL